MSAVTDAHSTTPVVYAAPRQEKLGGHEDIVATG